ncbi:MAG: isochorismatase family protein [Rhodospirillales bacterium]|nr:isochorismatase family protein [Rhodospirillales bacterium]
MTHVALRPEFAALIDIAAPVDRIGTGFTFTEGPVGHRGDARGGARRLGRGAGAWTNMSIEHTARTGADKGYAVILPEDCCSTMNADRHRASVQYAMQNVATVTTAADVIAALG